MSRVITLIIIAMALMSGVGIVPVAIYFLYRSVVESKEEKNNKQKRDQVKF